MKRIVHLVAVAAVAALLAASPLWAGGNVRDPGTKDEGTELVPPMPGDNRPTNVVVLVPDRANRVAVGQPMVVSLEANPTTGYAWTYKVSNPRSVAYVRDEYVPAQTAPGVVGSGGKHVFYFQAVAPGDCDIEMRYKRPWEANSQGEKVVRFKVNVGN